MKYSNYVQIKEDYDPFFSDEIDQQKPEAWQTFIPNDDWLALFEGLVESLERGKKPETLSMWVHGAYGTGKTLSAFVIKHLLEGPEDEARSYLARFGVNTSLVSRWEALRGRGIWIVSFRSGSAQLQTSERLVAEVQQSIADRLRLRNLKVETETFLEQVRNRIADESGAISWPNVFAKHRIDFPQFECFEDLKKAVLRWEPGSLEDVSLVLAAARAAEHEGFRWLDSSDKVKQWIKEVIAANNVAGILLIWDEFTDFFTNRSAPVTTLQEFAHATTIMPFYLYLIMHRSPQVLGVETDTLKKIQERFKERRYEMHPATVLELTARAWNIKDAERWSQKSRALWDRVSSPVSKSKLISEGAGLREYEKLIPIHPFSAYLMAQISQHFASSERTIFRLLKLRQKGSFSEYLESTDSDMWPLYTADYLWDYFFSGEGKDQVNEAREVATHFALHQEECQSDQLLRVFKGALVLVALSREMRTSSPDSILRPLRNNVELMFEGVMDHETVDGLLNQLTNKGLLHPVETESGDIEYTMASVSIDKSAVRKYMDAVPSLPSLLKESEAIRNRLAEVVFGQLDALGRMRLHLDACGSAALGDVAERASSSAKSYEVAMVLVVISSDSELLQASRKAEESAATTGISIVVFNDAIPSAEWNRYTELVAHQRYYAEDLHDSKNAQYYASRAEDSLSSVLHSVVEPGAVAYGTQQSRLGTSENPIGSVLVQGGPIGFRRLLDKLVEQKFPYRPEVVCDTETLYAESVGVKALASGLGGQGVFGKFRSLESDLDSRGFLTGEGYTDFPDHALSQMRAAIVTLLDQGDCELSTIWNTLMASPFGLPPVQISGYLFGVVMREALSRNLYYDDGTRSMSLDGTRLAELCTGVIKGDRRLWILRKTTPEGKRFSELTAEIFSLPGDTAFPETTRQHLREAITQAKYPLWSMKYCDVSPTAGKAIEILSAMLRDEAISADALSALAQLLGQTSEELVRIWAARLYRDGMQRFLAQANEDMSGLFASGRLTVDLTMHILSELMHLEVWLWREDNVAEVLPRLVERTKLVETARSVMDHEPIGSSEALSGICSAVKKSRLPAYVVFSGIGALGTADALLELPLQANDDAVLARFSELLAGRGAELRTALTDESKVLQTYLLQYFPLQSGLDVAEDILEALPRGFSGLTQRQDINHELEACIGSLPMKRLSVAARTMLERCSSCSSVPEWSQHYGAPAEWVAKEGVQLDVFNILGDKWSGSGEEITAITARLEQGTQNQEIEFLGDQGWVDGRILIFLLGQPDAIGVTDPTKQGELMRAFRRRMPSNPLQWTPPNARSAMQDALLEEYDPSSTKAAVMTTREEQLRSILVNLADDPIVGLRILRLIGDAQ